MTPIPAGNPKEPLVTSPPAGVRRKSTRFSSPQQTTFQAHNHTYCREHVTASTVLSQDDKYSELTMKIRGLLTEGQKVDDFFAIETIEIENTKGRWETSAQVPFNFTDL